MVTRVLLGAGSAVWYQPKHIGYGYLYGVDRGIPAVIEQRDGVWSYIRFAAKDGTLIPTRRVAHSNLIPRDREEAHDHAR